MFIVLLLVFIFGGVGGVFVLLGVLALGRILACLIPVILLVGLVSSLGDS